MSTKIYDAYKNEKYVTVADMGRLHSRLGNFRLKVQTQAVLKLASNEAWMALDYGEREEKLKAAIRGGSWGNPLSIGCSIVVYTHPKITGTIIQFFGFERNVKLPTRGFKDWHYQNQCDPDPRVSDKEWRQRKKEWDWIFSESSTPSDAGWSFPVIEESMVWILNHQAARVKAGKVPMTWGD